MGIYPYAVKALPDQRVPIWDSVTIAVGTEASNIVSVTLAFNDQLGNVVPNVVFAWMWLTSSSNGTIGNGTAPNGGVSFLLGGGVEVHAADMLYAVAAGTAIINVTESGSATLYMCILAPDGSITVSDPLIWTA